MSYQNAQGNGLIREPKETDISRLTELTEEVYGDFMKLHNIPMNHENLKATVTAFVKTKQCMVVERGNKIVGLMGWTLSPHPANFSCKIFQEVLWCLKSPNPMDASILLKAIEKKAMELKADIMILANLSIENEMQLRRIYDKMGFKYLESHYCKTIRS